MMQQKKIVLKKAGLGISAKHLQTAEYKKYDVGGKRFCPRQGWLLDFRVDFHQQKQSS